MTSKYSNMHQILKDILRSVAESQNIKDYETIPHKTGLQGDGFMSEFCTGEILNKYNKETTEVAIKCASTNPVAISYGLQPFFQNEVFFYSQVLPVMDEFQRKKGVSKPFDNTPKYFAGDVDSKRTFVAMENLKTGGYALYDNKKYFKADRLETVFKTFGKFHALSFAFKHENPEKYRNMVNNFSDVFNTIIIRSSASKEYVETAYLFALKAFHTVSEADILAKIKIIGNVNETLKLLLSYKGNYSCLIHGDCWSNNMLFKYKDSKELDIKLIDFQMARSSTPVHDLSYFFYSGASKEDMDKLDHYLNLYYQSFSEFATKLGNDPKKLLPLDVLKKEWKHYGLFGIIYGCSIWGVKLMDKEELSDSLNKDNIQMDDFNKFFKTKDYMERARNIYLHAVKYGIL